MVPLLHQQRPTYVVCIVLVPVSVSVPSLRFDCSSQPTAAYIPRLLQQLLMILIHRRQSQTLFGVHICIRLSLTV